MQFFRKLEPALNVGAASHFIIDSKKVLGNVVERVILELGGTFTKAHLSNLTVKLNGKVAFGPVSGTQLDLMNRYRTLSNDAARLPIDFTELVSRSIQGQLMGSVDTDASGITSFVIEGDIGGATNPTLQAYVQMRSPASMTAERGFDPRTRALINALIPTSVSDNAAGQFPHNLNYGSLGNALIKRVFIHSTVLTAFQVKRDSIDLWEDVSAALTEFVQEENGRQAQTNVYVWDPLQDGNQPDAIPTRVVQPNGAVREATFEWLFRVSGSGAHTVFVDTYTRLADL